MRYAPHSARFVVLLAALSALPGVSIDVALPTLPDMAEQLGVSPRQAQLTVSGFLMGAAVGQLAIGPLADRYGRRPIIIAGLLIYIAAALGALFSASIATLTVFRFLQGAGVATGFVLTRAIVRDLFDSRDAARILSTVMLIVSTASLGAPVLGAVLAVTAGWRTVFAAMAIAGAALVCAAALRLPESAPQRDPEALRPSRMLANYRRFFTTRICVSYGLLNACLYGGLIAYLSGSPFVLVNGVGHLSETVFGAVLALNALMLMLGAAASAYLITRLQQQQLILLGLTCVTAAALALVAVPWISRSMIGAAAATVLVAPMCLYAFGVGLIAPNSTAIGMRPLSDMAGAAASVMLSLQAAVGAGAGYLVSVWQDGASTSIALVVPACALGAVLIYRAAAAECSPAETIVRQPQLRPKLT